MASPVDLPSVRRHGLLIRLVTPERERVRVRLQGRLAPRTAIERWFTVPAGSVVIRWRLARATLGRLRPGAYELTAGRAGSPETAALLALTARAEPVIAAAGDIACNGTCGQAATGRLLAGLRPDAVLGLGDYQYERATLPTLRAHYGPFWGRFKDRTYPINGAVHDLYGTGAYVRYFRAGGPVPLRPEASYSFDIGAWHVVALNSSCFTRPECNVAGWTNWLRRDLQRNPRACALAYFHDAYWTSPTAVHEPSNKLGPWIDVLYEHRVDVVLQGGNHDYERFAPQGPDGRYDPQRGITAFVTGTGGRSHYQFRGTVPNTRARNDDTFGVLKLSLRPRGWDFAFIPVANARYTDRGSGRCH